MKNNIHVPEYALEVLCRLEQSGFEAYFAGGCVRDRLMGREPKDWDIAVSAPPEEVIEAFQGYKVIPTGIQHGTVSIVTGGGIIEVTTFRVDGIYSDNRRPDSVIFTRNLREDLSRRDFTVNALAYNPRTGVIDCFGGLADMENKLIRCVGMPEARFSEDALRIMRGARFACELGFTVEEETLAAMKRLRGLLHKIAAERISAELSRAILGPAFASFFAQSPELLATAVPELEAQTQNTEQYEILLKKISSAPPDIVTRLAIMFTRISETDNPAQGAKIAANALTALRYDRRTVNCVATLVKSGAEPVLPEEANIKKWLNRIGAEDFRRVLDMRKAQILAGNEATMEALKDLERAGEILERVLAEGLCYSLDGLAINGADLREAGVPEGPEIGRILKLLLEKVINGELENDKEALREQI